MRVLLGLAAIVVIAMAVVLCVVDDGEDAPKPASPSAETASTVPVPAAPSPSEPPAEPTAEAEPVEEGEPVGAGERCAVFGIVENEAGAPIDGARVAVKRLQLFVAAKGPGIERESITGADGGFRFDDLPKAKQPLFSLAVSRTGYYAVRSTVTPDEPSTIVLGVPGSVRGRVMYAGSDDPCVGAIVRLSNQEGGSGRAETDATGAYRIDALKPGSFSAFVQKDKLSPLIENVTVEAGVETVADFATKRPATLHGFVQDAATGAPVGGAVVSSRFRRQKLATAGPDGRFTLAQQPRGSGLITASGYVTKVLPAATTPTSAAAPLVIRLARGARVEGVVVQEGGERPPELRVVAAKDGDTRNLFFSNTSATVDDAGAFAIDGVPTDKPQRIVVVLAMRRVAESELLRLSPGETRRDVRVTIAAAGSIAGRVTAPSGEAVVGARVSVLQEGQVVPVPSATTTTGEYGRYTLEQIPVGPHMLTVMAKGFALFERPHTLPTAEAMSGVDIQLSDGLSISGTVRDSTGTPIPKAALQAHSARGGFMGSKTGRTDEHGNFEIRALRAGVYRVSAFSRGFSTDGRPVFAEAGAKGVDIVVVGMSGPVSGVVRDRATGAPVSRFSVRLLRDGRGFPRKFSDAEGRFRAPGQSPGRYGVLATADDGRVSGLSVVDLKPGASPPPVELWVEAGATVTGRVLTPAGEPLYAAQLEIERIDTPSGPVGRASTDREGRFRCGGLRRERVRIRATHLEWIAVERKVSLKDAPDPVDIRLAAEGGIVRLTVVAADGNRVAAAPVRFRRGARTIRPDSSKESKAKGGVIERADMMRLHQTDDDGRHVRRFLPRGRYTVDVDAPAGYGTIDVDVEPGVTRSVTLRLRR